MKKIVIVTIAVILVIAIIYFIMNYKNSKKEDFFEYSPAEEISEEQISKTMVTLYFKDKETNQIAPELRLIDSKLLIINPYEELIKLLINGPKSDRMEKVIPNNTKVNKIEIKDGIIILDLSKEFIEAHIEGKENEEITVYSIVNTLTELTEVNGVNILIDGERDKEFKDGLINFREIFIKK